MVSGSKGELMMKIISVVVVCLMLFLIATHISSHIVGETFNSSEYNTWIKLAHTSIVEGSEIVMDLNNTTIYTKNVDYEMDYMNSRIKVLPTGSMRNWTEYSISYIYGGER